MRTSRPGRRPQRSGFSSVVASWLAMVAVGVVVFVACGGSPDASTPDAAPGSTSSSTSSDTSAVGRPGEDIEMTAADFVNIRSMTKVRKFYIDNKLGYLDEAIAVANDPQGGVYPVGTVIQLVPQEAMVKRARGWDPATNDWEFFFLEVSSEGTKIATRGAAETVNQFGANCADCHREADPAFDFICEKDNGCIELPLTDELIKGLQDGDPRPMPKDASS